MIRVAIIDDEAEARDALRACLERYQAEKGIRPAEPPGAGRRLVRELNTRKERK